jgi:hypothetical protein
MATVVLLPLALALDCAAFRGRGFWLPRTTGAVARPWAHSRLNLSAEGVARRGSTAVPG